MNPGRFDVLVVGAGYAGSLTAMLLARIGRRVALVERGRHPRFAIGESSTPTADLLLRHLGERYELPELVGMSSYGRWRAAHPELGCGPKRGFSYFLHDLDRPFVATPDHATELLVAASVDEPSADLHWLREDVDGALCERAVAAGATLYDRTSIELAADTNSGWVVETRSADGASRTIEADLLIDASGTAGALAPFVACEDRTASLRTNTRAVFAHFEGVLPWADVLDEFGIPRDEYPFPCDAAALHHVFDGGWMWQLRFDDGTTSAGFVIDNDRHPPREVESPATEWSRWLDRLPTVARQFPASKVVRPADGVRRLSRVQSRRSPVAGENWALLPNTAGFVDPLHSTGIAYAVHGIARLVEGLAEAESPTDTVTALAAYATEIDRELDFVDELVHGCYASPRDSLYTATMPYFVAATRWEAARPTNGGIGSFLDAADTAFRTAVRGVFDEIKAGNSERALDWLRPYDVVGVLESDVRHMHHRSATKSGGHD